MNRFMNEKARQENVPNNNHKKKEDTHTCIFYCVYISEKGLNSAHCDGRSSSEMFLRNTQVCMCTFSELIFLAPFSNRNETAVGAGIAQSCGY